MSMGDASEQVATSAAATADVAVAPPPEDDELRAFCAALLEIQCGLVGAIAGATYLLKGQGTGLVARYPMPGGKSGPDALSAQMLSRFERIAVEVASSRNGRASGTVEPVSLDSGSGIYSGSATHRIIATPLVAEGKAHGAALVVVPSKIGNDEEALTRLALTSARFEAFLWRRQCFQEAVQRTKLRETLALLDASQQGRNAGTMGAIFCDELARRFGCTRVSIGLVLRESIRLIAVSGSDSVDRRGQAAVLIENAMEECADQDIEVLYPSPAELEHEPSSRRVTRAHAELSRTFGPTALLSLPLRVEGDLVGVALLERPANDPFPAQSAALLRLVAEFVGPALWTRRLADRGVIAVARDRALEFGEMLVGPRRTAWKLVALALLAVFVFAAAFPIPDRVKAGVEIRARVSRSIVPPFTGFLASSRVKPGDRVNAGQILAEMDTREIEDQIATTSARRDALQIERDAAQSAKDYSRAGSLQAQVDESSALLAQQINRRERSVIRSPITGVVGRGELEPLIGAKVDPTQVLFEIVTDDRMAELRVPERDIHRITPNQTGSITIKARPGEETPIRVERINPMAEVVKGDNVFLVEAAIDRPGDELLPGMSGTARLEAGTTTWLSRVLRPIIDEARMRLWW